MNDDYLPCWRVPVKMFVRARTADEAEELVRQRVETNAAIAVGYVIDGEAEEW